MIQFENTILVDCPVDRVFAFIADLQNTPKWNYYVKKVRKLTDGPIGVGTRYHQVRKTDEQDYQITAYDPDHRLVIKTLADSKPRFERWFEFEQEENGTKIVDTWTLDLGGNPLIERIGTRKVKFAVAENLGKLKDLLEKGATQLQDGRVIEI